MISGLSVILLCGIGSFFESFFIGFDIDVLFKEIEDFLIFIFYSDNVATICKRVKSDQVDKVVFLHVTIYPS